MQLFFVSFGVNKGRPPQAVAGHSYDGQTSPLRTVSCMSPRLYYKPISARLYRHGNRAVATSTIEPGPRYGEASKRTSHDLWRSAHSLAYQATYAMYRDHKQYAIGYPRAQQLLRAIVASTPDYGDTSDFRVRFSSSSARWQRTNASLPEDEYDRLVCLVPVVSMPACSTGPLQISRLQTCQISLSRDSLCTVRTQSLPCLYVN